jgi:HEAT repeat protein
MLRPTEITATEITATEITATEITARRRAAALAGHRGDEESARRALTDPAPTVRATALGALARLGALRWADVQAGAGDPAPEVRARAAELAVGLGSAVVEQLVGALADRDARVVEAGCFALGELGDDGSGAVPALARVSAAHSEPLCREAAVAALGAIGDAGGLPAILAATADKPAVRRRAVLALAPFSGPEVDAALERALGDRDWQVRQAAEDLTGRAT